jgi:ABC-type multidrug transport system ATPase subunit
MDEASKCDRVGLIQKGHLLTVAKPGSLKNSLQGSLFAIHPSGSTFTFLEKIRTFPLCRQAWLAGQAIHVRLSEENGERELRELALSVDPDSTCARIEPGIEDAFIELMEDLR